MESSTTPTQAMLLGALFNAAWNTFQKHWKSVVLLTLFVALPLNLLGAIANAQVQGSITDTADLSSVFSGATGAGFGISIALLSLAGILIPLGIVAILKADEQGEHVDAQEALRRAIGHWGAGLITAIIMVLLLILLAILLIIPAIIFGIFWAFAIFIVMHDDLRGMAALKESKRIVQGHWWKVFGNMLALSFVSSIIASIVSSPFNAIHNDIVSGTLVNTIASIASSFTLIGGYLLYRNLKSLKPAASNA